MSEDPIKRARALAEQTVQQRVMLVDNFKQAQEWTGNVAAVRTQVRQLVNQAPTQEARDMAEQVVAELDKLYEGARGGERAARSAAKEQWSQADLQEMGLIKTRRRKKSTDDIAEPAGSSVSAGPRFDEPTSEGEVRS